MAMAALSFAGAASTAFQAPAALMQRRAVQMISIEELPGATIEVSNKVWDPLGLSQLQPYGSENFEWMRTAEIKHGRVCMAASVGWLLSEMGVHFPGKLSTSADLDFADVGVGLKAWDNVPMAGKMQVLAAAGLIEICAETQKPHYMKAGPPLFTGPKANSRLAELKNGRAAMLAVASFYFGTVIPGSVPALPSTWV